MRSQEFPPGDTLLHCLGSPVRDHTGAAPAPIGHLTRALLPLFLVAAGCSRAATPAEESVTSAIQSSDPPSLQLQVLTNSCGTNQAQTFFEVTNTGSTPVNLSDISIKYWVFDASGQAVVPNVWTGGCVTNVNGNPSCVHQVTGVTPTATSFSPACGPDPTNQANWEVTISDTDGTTLPPGAVWSNIQSALHLANYSNFTPGTTDWYSPCLSGSSYAQNGFFALYFQGMLVPNAGTPPSCRAPCGGLGQPVCQNVFSLPNFSPCQAGLQALPNGTCGVSNLVLNPPEGLSSWVSVNVTGPLTMQGEVPWGQCITGALSRAQPVSPPCPAELQQKTAPPSSPHWAPGSGFMVTDAAANQTAPKLFVASPNVTLQTDVSFTDDTAALAVQVPIALEEFTNGGKRFSCPHTFFPGTVEGNHAHYTVRAQQWVDNFQSCPAPQPSPNADTQPLHFDAPSPDGSQGCWVDLASAQTELFGSSAGAASATIAAANAKVTQTLSLPVTLTNVATFVRYVVQISEADSRIPVSANGVKWPGGQAISDGDICSDFGSGLSTDPLGTTCTLDCFDFIINHPEGNGSAFSHQQASQFFQLVVQPLALAQLKVLPYTLLYAPPGNASTATYVMGTSYGVSLAFDNKLANNQSNTVDNKQSNTASFANSGSGLASQLGGVGIGQSFMDSSTFDQSTQLGTGTISDVASTQASSLVTIQTLGPLHPPPTNTPGANGTRPTEAFWGDTFYLLVHPQIALWQLGGVPVVSMVGARGTPMVPSFITPSVGDLDSCAKGTGLFANGYPIPLTTPQEVLTSAECAELLTLDPLYVAGQSYPAVTTDNRYLHVTDQQYGVDPVSLADDPFGLTVTLTNTNTNTVQAVGSYTATVTDVLTTSNTIGGTLGAYGVTTGDNFSNTETNTTSTNWNVTLQSSFTATAQSSVGVSGVLDDHHGLSGTTALPYKPEASLYRDSVFGSFLFVDPTAP
jgi:hypothetical protein